MLIYVFYNGKIESTYFVTEFHVDHGSDFISFRYNGCENLIYFNRVDVNREEKSVYVYERT